jgi:hypothetical protein
MPAFTDRRTLADAAVACLTADADLGETCLRGSLVDGPADDYSDIDIGLNPTTITDADAVERAVSRFESRFDVEFHDWATSLLPDRAVVTFYLRDVPLFWNIDLEIVVPADLRRATRDSVVLDPVFHALKVWPLALKYSLREDEAQRADVTRFVTRHGAAPADGWVWLRAALGTALDTITQQATDRHRPFLARCRDTYARTANPRETP